MRTLSRILARGAACAALAIAFAAVPAAAETAPASGIEIPAFCPLEPGVYGLVDSTGSLVGILIVYPDCRMEVFRRQTT